MSDWKTAALLPDRVRRAIRDRVQAGEPSADVATDYGVPLAFVDQVVAWQLGGEDPSVGAPPHPPDFAALLTDLRTLDGLYNRDRIAQPFARQIERIFDRWLHDDPPAGVAPPQSQAVCANGHTWTNQFGDDWTPDHGMRCDCGKKSWGERP